MDNKRFLTTDELRELVAKLNRTKFPNTIGMYAKEKELSLSPPYHGKDKRVATTEYPYSPILSGLHNKQLRQKIRVTGSASGSQPFSGISGSTYGMATGGSYQT